MQINQVIFSKNQFRTCTCTQHEHMTKSICYSPNGPQLTCPADENLQVYRDLQKEDPTGARLAMPS